MLSLQQSKSLEHELQSELDLRFPGRDNIAHPSSYIHTNDPNYKKSLAAAKAYLQSSGDAFPRVGLVVGTGGLFSAMPELPIDIWFVVDKNDFVIEWMKRAKRVLRNSTTLEEYTREIYHNEEFYQIRHLSPKVAQISLKWERESLGEFHFTFNEDRFRKAREALLRTVVVESSVDLASLSPISALAEVFRKRRWNIPFANLTNVYEHSPLVSATLQLLPFKEQAFLKWSEYRSRYGSHDHFSIGLQDYLREAGKYYHQAAYIKERTILPQHLAGGDLT